jgi:hypothetical protein
MNLSKITLATLLSLASVASFAAANSTANVSGAYAQLGAGWGNKDLPASALTTLTQVKQTGFQGNVAGGYLWAQPSDWAFGAELSATFYPTFNANYPAYPNATVKERSYSINVLGVAKYFVSDVLSFVAKAGPSFYIGKQTIYLPGSGNQSTNEYSSGVMGDVGVAYNVTPAFAVTLDAQVSRQWIRNAGATTTLNPYGFLAGVSYNFGA